MMARRGSHEAQTLKKLCCPSFQLRLQLSGKLARSETAAAAAAAAAVVGG